MVRVALRPTIRWPGVIRPTATQKITCGATTTTLALAVLLDRFVSGLSPITTTVFVWVPTTLGVVTSVIVTFWPAVIVPMSHLRVAPPVQVPWLLEAETYVLP